MKHKSLFIGGALALALAAGGVGYASLANAHPSGGWGMMGGYGGGMMGGYGPGWMHGSGPGATRGYGPGAMRGYGPENCPWYRGSAAGPGQSSQTGLNLSTDDVKKELERWLAVQGNPRLKVGEIREKDGDTIEADIVTKDNSVVQQFKVDRKTGFYRPTGG